MCGNSKQTAIGKKDFGKRPISFFTGLLCVLAATQSLAGTAYTMTDLGTLGGDNTSGNVINARGQIAGYSDLESGADHIFLYDHTGMHDLGTLGGPTSKAYAINSSGHVVGVSETEETRREKHAFLYDNTGMHDLGAPSGVITARPGRSTTMARSSGYPLPSTAKIMPSCTTTPACTIWALSMVPHIGSTPAVKSSERRNLRLRTNNMPSSSTLPASMI